MHSVRTSSANEKHYRHLVPVQHLFEGKRDKRRELSRNVSCIERIYIANPRVFEPILMRKKQHLAACKHVNT